MTFRVATLIALLCPLYSGTSFACAIPLKGHFDTLEELVAETNQIVLVRFLCSSGSSLPCSFEVIETLKGPSNQEPELGWFLFSATHTVSKNIIEPAQDFNGHQSELFWSQKAWRSRWFGGSCAPAFTFWPDKEYLIFVDSPANPYAAELILDQGDKWLHFVKETVAK